MDNSMVYILIFSLYVACILTNMITNTFRKVKPFALDSLVNLNKVGQKDLRPQKKNYKANKTLTTFYKVYLKRVFPLKTK